MSKHLKTPRRRVTTLAALLVVLGVAAAALAASTASGGRSDKVTLRVDPQEKEQDTTNNEQSTIVKVFEGGLNVLYVEGELRVEQRYLRRSLNASPPCSLYRANIL